MPRQRFEGQRTGSPAFPARDSRPDHPLSASRWLPRRLRLECVAQRRENSRAWTRGNAYLGNNISRSGRIKRISSHTANHKPDRLSEVKTTEVGCNLRLPEGVSRVCVARQVAA